MADEQLSQIEHIVVLMLENRGFDHMLGWLKPAGPEWNGLTGDEWCPIEPADFADPDLPVENRQYVTRGTGDAHAPNPVPGELFTDTNTQLFGRRIVPDGAEASNRGFVINYGTAIDRYNQFHPWNLRNTTAPSIMECHLPEQLPTLSRLALEFGVCDAWHASAPAQTFANRAFLHAATSDGGTDNIPVRIVARDTVFGLLDQKKVPWKVYFHDFPTVLLCKQPWSSPLNFHLFDRFKSDAAEGKLPSYAFIEPQYYQQGTTFASDMHPAHDTVFGEQLVAEVYNALRAGPAWKSTLLVIVWDEHGGTYDHVAPPAATPPDGKVGDQGFRFDRFGMRVPAILVSPWIEKGSVFRPPLDGPPCDHTSIIATLRQRFQLGGPLTARDAAAPHLAGALNLQAPREDTPPSLPIPPSPSAASELQAFVSLTPLQDAIHEASKLIPVPASVTNAVEKATEKIVPDAGQAIDRAHTTAATVKSKIKAFFAHLF
jgi:phospholipase C